jgi:hypothetical protein
MDPEWLLSPTTRSEAIAVASPTSGEAFAGNVPTTITVVLVSPATSIHLSTSAVGLF